MTSPYLGAMLAHEFEERRIKSWPVAYEPKKDGIRITFVDGQAYTRRRNTFPTLERPAEYVADMVPARVHVDVEVRAKNWNETSKLLKRKKNIDYDRIRAEVDIFIFDAFNAKTIAEKEPYSERRKAIEWLAGRLDLCPYHFRLIPSALAYSMDELNAAKARALADGDEGIMVKTLDGVYTPKRSWAWMKMKAWKDITVTIKAVTHGWELCRECMTKEKREARAIAHNEFAGIGDETNADAIEPNPSCPTCHGAAKGVPRPDLLGSLVCVDEHGNEWGVGMGFTDDMKRTLMEHQPIGKTCDVKIQDEAAGDSANAITGRHGVFLRFRDDGE